MSIRLENDVFSILPLSKYPMIRFHINMILPNQAYSMIILLPDEDLSTLEEKVIRDHLQRRKFLTRGSGDIDWGSRGNLTAKGVDWKSATSIHSAHPAKVGLGLVALSPPSSSSASQQASRPAWSSLSPSWGSPKLSTPGKPTLVRSPTRRGWRSQTSFTRLSLRLTLIIPS